MDVKQQHLHNRHKQGFVRRNLSSYLRKIKDMAYKGPSGVTNPGICKSSGGPSVKKKKKKREKDLQDELEKVQKWGAGFATGNYTPETESMTRNSVYNSHTGLQRSKRYKQAYQLMTKKPLLGALETSIHNLFNSHMPELMLISRVSSLKLLEAGMHFLYLLYPLLNV